MHFFGFITDWTAHAVTNGISSIRVDKWADVKGQQVELFWLNILKWLSPPKTCQVPIPPGIVK